MEGGVIGQILGGQIGSISIELEHSARTCPCIQTHWQSAITLNGNIKIKSINSLFIPYYPFGIVSKCVPRLLSH